MPSVPSGRNARGSTSVGYVEPANVEPRTYVYSEGKIEGKPDNDDRSKGTADLCSPQGLDEEEQNEDGARGSHNRGSCNV